MSTDNTLEAAKHGQLLKVSAGALTVAPESPGGAGESITPPHEVEGPDDESRVTIFGELQPPDVHSDPFPQRLLHWKPSGKMETQPAPIPIVVTQEVLESVNRHVSQDLKRELGGFLLGNRYVCPNSKHTYVRIDVCTEAKFASSTPVSMELVNNTFLHLCEEMSGKYRGKDVVGWYHSHPKHEVFLSPDDIGVHESRFKHDWMVALVINPNKKIGAFFRRHDGVLNPRASTDFYELLEIGAAQTTTYMPWDNYRCHDVETGRIISPRLLTGRSAGDSTYKTPPPSPPWWLSPPRLPSLPQWVSLMQVKPAALIIGSLMFGIILYAMLISRGAKPARQGIGSTLAARQPSLPPSIKPGDDQTNVVDQTQSSPTEESETSGTGAEAPGSKPGVRAGARAGAGGRGADGAKNRVDSGRRSKTPSGTEGVTRRPRPPKGPQVLTPARRTGAFGESQ